MENKLIKINIAIWAIIAVILTALLVYFIYAGNNFNIYNSGYISNSYSVQKQQSADISNCNNISLDFSSADISVKTTDDTKLKVIEKSNSKLSDNQKFTLTQDGNNILIKDNNFMHTSINIFGFGFGAKQVEIYIPKNYTKDLVVKTSSGDISFDSDINLYNIACEQSSGNFRSGNVTANNISLKASSGDLESKKLNAKLYNLDSKSGNINISGISGSGQIEASSGDIIVNYDDIGDYSNINARSGNVRVNIPKSLSYDFNGKCFSGEINSNFDLNYKNKRGNEASGEVGSAPFKKITVETNSGDIDINRDR